MYVELTVSQTMEHFLDCHANAFAAFGGAPSRIMVDNRKSAVLQHHFGQAPVFKPRCLEFAKHYGFSVTACNVRKTNEKGRVENAVGYVKKNFLNANDLPDFRAMAPAVEHWLASVANVRIHATTHKRPVDMCSRKRNPASCRCRLTPAI
jgi:transposase